MIKLDLTPATRWGLNLIALLGAVVALRLGESIFIPTVIAVLLAALLWPVASGQPPVTPIIDAFISGPSPWYAVGVFAFYLAVITLEGYVVVPVVMGRSMELNATTVMLACLFWELGWGLTGLFLAMPLMAAIKAICYHVPGMRPWANLMSTAEVDLPTDAALSGGDADLIDEDKLAAIEKAKKLAGDGRS